MKTPDEYYNRQRECEHALRIFSFWLVAMIILIVIAVRCEKQRECPCWTCYLSNTKYYPGEQPDKVNIWLEYPNIFCDCPDEKVHEWERNNTWSDTISGVWNVQKAICKNH